MVEEQDKFNHEDIHNRLEQISRSLADGEDITEDDIADIPDDMMEEFHEEMQEEEASIKEAESKDNLPPWLQDEPPVKIGARTKWQLMHGMNEEEIMELGTNPSTVRICAQELERDGYRERPKKTKVQLEKVSGTAVTKSSDVNHEIKTYAKGAPPEALINSVNLPLNTPESKVFESGMKTGMGMLVLAVRVVQELSAIGIQQTKPLIDMSKSMREGEAIAAKNAAMEAAQEAAMKVGGVFGPHIESLENTLANLDKGSSPDPMKAMMARSMEPMMQQMMKMFMPNMGGMQMPQGQPAQPQAPQQDWTIVKE
jgi:hypothetical protein